MPLFFYGFVYMGASTCAPCPVVSGRYGGNPLGDCESVLCASAEQTNYSLVHLLT